MNAEPMTPLPVSGVVNYATTNSTTDTEVSYRLYKRRFWILLLFSLSGFFSGVLFPIYVCMAVVNKCYYDTSPSAISWTTMTFMILYIVLVFPITKLSNHISLRWIIILGSLISTIASAIQFATLSPDSFAYVMVSVAVASLANVFVVGAPPFVAATWFSAKEVSRACAVGILGNQLGIASGYLIPSLMVPADCSKKDLITQGKWNLALFYTAANLFIFILIALTLQNKPPSPPSQAESLKKNEDSISYVAIVLRMGKNKQFLLLSVIFGIMNGIILGFGTVLNDLVSKYFMNKTVEIGWMGFLFGAFGLIGAMLSGFVLDATHRFKETSQGIIVFSLISHVVFSGMLYVDTFWIEFVTASIYGFFLASFFTVGYEYGVETIYPDSEYVCACLMSTSMNVFGLIITQIMSTLLYDVGPIYSNAFVAICLILCCVLSYFLTTDYKRSKIYNENLSDANK